MPSVVVTNVSRSVAPAQIGELFSYCGKIEPVQLLSPGTFEVVFKLDKAVETALLLKDAELEGSVISVSTPSIPGYDEATSVAVGDNKVKPGNHSKLADADVDDEGEDIPQEEKPKLAVLAQLLASGYHISDSLIDRAIQIDQKKGLSASFKSFIHDLDSKYIHSHDPESVAHRKLKRADHVLHGFTHKLSSFAKLRSVHNYLDKAAASPSGLRIHQFYLHVAKEVKEVRAEANRLYNLQKAQEQAATEHSASAST